MNQKMWGGRFSERASASLDEFWSSIAFDLRLYREDIRGSQAHAAMLAAQGIITAEEQAKIAAGLNEVLQDFEAGRAEWTVADEDIHMNVERMLTQKIGATAGKLHTARSRNDQVALDMHLWVGQAAVDTVRLLDGLQAALLGQAQTNESVILPGYTHLQRAQPVLLAHHLLAYCWMFDRDIRRLMDGFARTNISPLGAGAIAGTTFPIDRERVAQELGFTGVYENSMDAVSDRDFILELLSSNAIIASHLSRFCEEMVLWSSQEFGFVTISDGFSSGSSMMPQKKNPDLAELVRGKTGRVYGALMGMLTVVKGLPLTYNKDFQEDKEALFDSVDTVQQSLFHLCGMVSAMKVNGEAMRRAAQAGFLNATDLADYLVTKGVPFREAHEVSGRAVALCLKQGSELEQLSLEQLRTLSPAIDQDVYEALRLETVVGRRITVGGTASGALPRQFSALEARRAATAQWLTEREQ